MSFDPLEWVFGSLKDFDFKFAIMFFEIGMFVLKICKFIFKICNFASKFTNLHLCIFQNFANLQLPKIYKFQICIIPKFANLYHPQNCKFASCQNLQIRLHSLQTLLDDFQMCPQDLAANSANSISGNVWFIHCCSAWQNSIIYVCRKMFFCDLWR